MTAELLNYAIDCQSLPLFIMPGGIRFEMVYLSAFLAGMIGFTVVGLHKKYPVSSWVTIVAVVMVSFLTGLILFSYPVKVWPAIFFGTYNQVQYIKYVPGGILFAVFGLLVVRKILSFRPSVGDFLIIFLPVLAVIQRVGCLINGCCYGTPTNLPWAVKYPATSALFQIQLEKGMISPHDAVCQGVHPTQLYMIMGYLMVFAILVITRKKFQIFGTRSLFGISLLALVRFVVEFWREPKANVWYSISWMGLSFLQWTIIAFILLSIVLIAWKTHKNIKSDTLAEPCIEKPFLNFSIIFIMFAFVWQIREIFDFTELLMLACIFSISSAITMVRVFQKITLPSLRWLSFAMLIVAFFGMSQQIAETPKDTLNPFKKTDWFGVGINAGAGNYHEVTRDCSGNITGTYDRNYLVYGGDFSYHLIPKSDQQLTTGVNFFYQEDKILDYQYLNSYQGTVINPYFIYDFKKVGLGTGLHFTPGSFASYGDHQIIPSFYFRLGRRDKLYTEFNLMQNFYKDGASAIGQFALGGGFGQLNKNSLRCGLGFFPNSRTAFFMEGKILINGLVYLKPGFAIGDGLNGSLGLEVLLGKDRKKR